MLVLDVHGVGVRGSDERNIKVVLDVVFWAKSLAIKVWGMSIYSKSVPGSTSTCWIRGQCVPGVRKWLCFLAIIEAWLMCESSSFRHERNLAQGIVQVCTFRSYDE